MKTSFKNKYGNIPLGSKVTFEVENPSLYCGDRCGILSYNYNSEKFYIKTENSGDIIIGDYLGAYLNTVELYIPLKRG